MKHVIGAIGLAILAILLMGGAICTQCTGPRAATLEEVHRLDIRAGEMLDSCIAPNPPELPTLGPRPC